jgi:hypothetical protein
MAPAPTAALDGFNGETQLVEKEDAEEAFAPTLFLAPIAQ